MNVVVPAVLAGNAVVVKHSPRTPLCGEHFARAFAEAGAPDGRSCRRSHCDHATSERIVGDPRIDHVLFTGSVLGGHRIQAAAAKRFLHVGLELGGNDPAYVAADCDLDKTVENIVDGAIYNAGQSCCAVERVYVHRSLYATLRRGGRAARPRLRARRSDAATRRRSARSRSRTTSPELEAFVADAEARARACVVGRQARRSVGRQGPLLRGDAARRRRRSDAELMQKESFGPILAVAPVDSDEEALAQMNDSRLGLTASVWTRDRERAARMARALEFGTVYMNRCDCARSRAAVDRREGLGPRRRA